jgi:hypothetical protein
VPATETRAPFVEALFRYEKPIPIGEVADCFPFREISAYRTEKIANDIAERSSHIEQRSRFVAVS